ncbi:MAG TPA: hypothetical protein VJO15_02845 [Dehalococcoidia bacterium]|nr:hypothetical protein [Dehalococcoidia bacterium]
MDEERKPVVAQILDNLALWLFLAAAIGFLYMVWATIEILNHWVGPMTLYTPFAVPVIPGR